MPKNRTIGQSLPTLYYNLTELYHKADNPDDRERIGNALDQMNDQLEHLIDQNLDHDDEEYKTAVKKIGEATKAVNTAIDNIDNVSKAIQKVADAVAAISKALQLIGV